MQNEELRRAQVELDAARERYFDLYDLAPVGYCTISEKGLILEANLTAAGLLFATRDELVMKPITRFIVSEDEDIFYLHRKKLFDTSMPQECELRMLKKDGSIFWALLESVLARDADGSPVCRVVMSDITARKEAEEALLRSEAHFKLLSETAEQLIIWKNIQVVMEALCQKAMRHLDCHIFLNYLVDQRTGRLHLNAFGGITEDEARKVEWIAPGEAISGSVVHDQTPVVVENISTTTDSGTKFLRDHGIEAYACWPMIVQNKITVTLCFGTKTRTSFSKEDLTLIKALAAHMATALQRTILVDEIRESQDLMENKVREKDNRTGKHGGGPEIKQF